MKITKRILPVILLFATLWLTAVNASAATQYSDGAYTFEKTEDGCAVITDCNLSENEIEVPGNVLGYPVNGIGKYAFLNYSTIRSVTLPASVQSVGEYAFAENADLENADLETVVIPRLCESIADNAFFNSPNVTIRCWYGSAADDYSKEKHIPCEYLDTVPVGDTNSDGEIQIDDVTSIQLHLAEIRLLDGINLYSADVDQNGIIDIADATALQMYLAEYELTYPIGQPIRMENALRTE